MTKRIGAVLMMVGCTAALLGCSRTAAAGMTKDQLRQQLTTGAYPLKAEQADCIVNGFETKGVAFDEYQEPTRDDQKAVADVVTGCLLQTTTLTPRAGALPTTTRG